MTYQKNEWGIAIEKTIFIKIVILLMVLNLSSCVDDTSKKEAVKNATPDIVTNSIELYQDYKSNEISADNKYKNKILMVVGPVDRIGKDILDKPYITLLVGKYSITGVQCFIQPSQTQIASSLVKGDWVMVVGRCKGKFMNVLIEDCLVDKIPPPKRGKK